MILVSVNNSYSRVSGLTASQEKELRELLSYSLDAKYAYFRGSFRPRKRCLLSKKGDFPTGLLPRVLEFAKIYKIVGHVTRPLPVPKINVGVFKVKPYQEQLEAADLAVKLGRGIISACTGSGKSLIIALIASRLHLNTLVVVPTLELKQQLMASLLEVFGTLEYLTIENIDSSNLEKEGYYDCLIIDEAHHVAAKTYQKLNKTVWTSIYHRFFLTATPFRNQTEETLLFESIAGQVIYKLSYKDAVSKGYIVPLEAYYYEVPKVSTNAFTWAEVYSELVVNNEPKNDLIAALGLRLNKAGIPGLILVKEVKHGDLLLKKTGLFFINGSDEESRKYLKEFNKGLIKVLIGTTGILGEGVDTKPCEYVIIAGLGKAKSAFMQAVGRALRKYPGKQSAKVIIIKDRSHKYLARHFNAQCAILKEEYGITAQKLEL